MFLQCLKYRLSNTIFVCMIDKKIFTYHRVLSNFRRHTYHIIIQRTNVSNSMINFRNFNHFFQSNNFVRNGHFSEIQSKNILTRGGGGGGGVAAAAAGCGTA